MAAGWPLETDHLTSFQWGDPVSSNTVWAILCQNEIMDSQRDSIRFDLRAFVPSTPAIMTNLALSPTGMNGRGRK